MPGEDGLALLAELQAQGVQPVIVMSAYTDVATAAAAYRSGAVDYLAKPFDLDQAVAAVERALADTAPPPAAEAGGARPHADGRERGDARGVPADRPGRRQRPQRADHRRDRHRQGAGGARAARGERAARQAVRGAEHRGDSVRAAGKRAVRPRGRRVHRRHPPPRRPLRAGRGRHAVPGRDRRHAAGPADAPAARAGRRRVLPRGRARADARRRAHRRRHPSGSGRARGHRAVPRRPAAPARRGADRAAAAAPAAQRHPEAGRSISSPRRRWS